MPLSMSQTLELAGCNRGQFQQWIARDVLKTKYDDPGQGRSRLFSRDNVIELAFLSAFSKGGASVSQAVAYTQSILRQDKVGTPRNWIVFPAGNLTSAVATNDLAATMNKYREEPALVVINVRHILDRIDAALKAAAKKEQAT